jgi:PAS domain S-box-containing protein
VNLIELDIKDEKLTLLNMAIESAGIGTWVFDLLSNKKYFDKKASGLLGFTPTKYKRTYKEFLERVLPEDRGEVKKQFISLIKKKMDIKTEFRVIWPDGTLKFLTAKAKTITDENGAAVRLIGLIWDITDQKQLQNNLQESIRKTDSIINNLNGAVFRCKFDNEMTMEYISEGIMGLSGYPLTDYLRNNVRSFASLIYIDDKERVINSLREEAVKKNSCTIEFRIVTEKNEIKWILCRYKGIFEREKIASLEGYLSDITDRKKAEEELKNSLDQLHKVAQHIEEVRENERVTISRELHDDLGQALTAVKIDLASIKQEVTDMSTVLKINKTSALVSDTIKTVQRITSQLRPQIIDDLGLETAIEWYTKEFEQRNRINIFLDIDSSLVIAPDVSLIIFRIMQEALTNIARHSKANSVVIKLFKTREKVDFSVSDNGVGITEDMINSTKSFGIINMKERAASLGGTLKIYREEGRFTIINLVFPLSNKGINENSDL